MQTGKIEGISNHGTMWGVTIDGKLYLGDHRPMRHALENLACEAGATRGVGQHIMDFLEGLEVEFETSEWSDSMLEFIRMA